MSLFEGAVGGRWFLLDVGVAVARAGGCGLEASLGIKGVVLLFAALAAVALREGICGLLLAELDLSGGILALCEAIVVLVLVPVPGPAPTFGKPISSVFAFM